MPFKRSEDDFTRSLKLYRKDPIFNFWYTIYGIKYWFIQKHIDFVRHFDKDYRRRWRL
jgi:hypothetical protein